MLDILSRQSLAARELYFYLNAKVQSNVLCTRV